MGGDGQSPELKKRYHPFAAAMCTISVFHMKSVLNVVSRHFGVAFNIPRHNVGIYASKLISYRFFLGMIGSFFELVLFHIVEESAKKLYENYATDLAKEIEDAGTPKGGSQIKNAVDKEADPIEHIGKDSTNPAHDIADKIQAAANGSKNHIKNAVGDEAKLIEEAGTAEDDKEKRKKKIKERSMIMGVRIMEHLYDTDPGGVGAQINSKASELVGTGFSDPSGIRGAIDTAKHQILCIIEGKAGDKPEKYEEEIKKYAAEITSSIVGITQIKEAIEGATDSTNISPGVIQSTIEYILIKNATQIAEQLGTGDAEQVAGHITGELNADTYQKTIAKSIFGMVIGEIIKDKAETIAQGTGTVDKEKIQNKVQEQVKQEIVNQNKRREYMVKALAGQMAWNIMSIEAIKDLYWKIKYQVVLPAIKGIIVAEASTIAGQVSADTIRTKVQQQVTSQIEAKLQAKKVEIADGKGAEIAEEERKGLSMATFIIMVICRAIFLRKLYTSTNLGYHAYIILNVEGLSWGFVQMTLFPLTPMHSAVTTMSIDVSTMTIFFFQLALDAFLFHRPLFMIKIQMWIIVFWNLAAIPVWACSIYETVSKEGAFYNYDSSGNDDAVWSPFWMFFFVSLLKDYMFPGVIPYALLTPDQAHLTNIVFPPFYILGSIIVIILDETDKGREGWFGGLFDCGREMNGFKKWNSWYNCFWLLYIPQVVNYYYAHKAIHTTGEASKFILGNRGFVLFMAIVMQLGYSILESLSFVCVANYTFSNTNFNERNGTKVYLETHNLMAEVYRFMFSKTSVGYNNLRNRYGLGMNVVHPHRLRPPGAWYWIKQSCAIACKDTMNDLRMNIGDYL